MTTSPPPTVNAILKTRILDALADGVDGFRCTIDADRCRTLLAEARGWNDEQWQAVARELHLTK